MHNPLSLSTKRTRFLEQVGRAMLLAAMVLPAAGILVMAGDLLSRAGMPFASILADAGFEMIHAMPLLIAVCTAFSLSAGQAGLAALSGAVALLIMNKTGSSFLNLLNAGQKDPAPFNMGLLAGLAAGLTVSCLCNNLDRIVLPGRMNRFRMSRLLPVISAGAAFLEGLAAGAAWTWLQRGLSALAVKLPAAGPIGAFAYGFLNRLLMPFGLHHVLNREIWFRYGEFTDQSGNLVLGDLNRYLAGDPTAGRSIAGFYEMMIFALPAAAICLILTSRAKRRRKMIILMTIAGLSALVSGFSEPLELLLLFASPILYVLLALLYGLSQAISFQLQIHIGFDFSTGLTDLLKNWNLADHPDRIWQTGLVMAALTFAVIYLAVRLLKAPAPGRERETEDEELEAAMKVTSIPSDEPESLQQEPEQSGTPVDADDGTAIQPEEPVPAEPDPPPGARRKKRT